MYILLSVFLDLKSYNFGITKSLFFEPKRMTSTKRPENIKVVVWSRLKKVVVSIFFYDFKKLKKTIKK